MEKAIKGKHMLAFLIGLRSKKRCFCFLWEIKLLYLCKILLIGMQLITRKLYADKVDA